LIVGITVGGKTACYAAKEGLRGADTCDIDITTIADVATRRKLDDAALLQSRVST
jgi:hypothetical protein